MADDELTRVDLAAEARWHERTLVVAGRATVPDAALVSWQVTHALHPSFREEGTAEVADGRFEVTLDTGSWPTGAVELWLAFQTVTATAARQPDAVTARYGATGERMSGEQVVAAGALRRAELVLTA